MVWQTYSRNGLTYQYIVASLRDLSVIKIFEVCGIYRVFHVKEFSETCLGTFSSAELAKQAGERALDK